MLNSTNEGECASNQGGIVPEHDAAQENLAVNVDTVAEKALYELKRHESGDQYMGFESGDAPKEMAKEITPIEKAEVSDHVDPFVGMVFESEEDAKEYYLAYALRVGFIIRSNRVLRSKRDGTNIGRDFVCSKEGFRAKKYQGTLRPRPKTREGCKAMLRVKKEDSGKWVVSKFSEEHSHALVPPKKVPRPRTRRQPDAIGISNNSFNDSGIKSSNGSLLGSQPVGPTSFGCNLQDCKNHIQCIRKTNLENDAQQVLQYFNCMQAKNQAFFYATQSDEEDHVANFFWVDARSRIAYSYFGDVVSFDTTYKTKRYGMPFACFVGVNHHNQYVVFGCALLRDETEESLVWLFSTWLEAMSGRHPVAIITDQNAAMTLAAAKVFPRTGHRFCKWHIHRKFQEKLGLVARRHPNFKGDFSECINMSGPMSEFESCWMSLIYKYDLRDNAWLQLLHNSREQWLHVYLQDVFFTNISTGGRSEGIYTFFDGYLNANSSLQVFVKQCEKALDKQYEMELEEDFNTSFDKPNMKTGFPMETQVADIYTRVMFLKFQDELLESLRFVAEITEEDAPTSTFRVAEYGAQKPAYIVTFNAVDVRASCNCQMFEHGGILCRHVLIVFRMKNVMELPSHYIVKRWTRNATNGPVFDENGVELQAESHTSRILRYNELCRLAIKCATEGAANKDVFNFAMRTLRKALEDIIGARRIVGPVAQPSTGIPANGGIIETTICEVSQSESTKGHPPRIKHSLEKQTKRKRHCVICKGVGHDQRKCPNKANTGPTSDIVGFVAPISQQNGGIGEERLEFFDGTTVVLTSSRLDMNEPSAFHDSETDRSFQFAAI
ncbi:protein FAR1-RELATED SEQUENCE 5 isoform X1 [Amborella trichopoda]|uniref:protein FAR1-RELATED SEQUENCE 5 isoform X1 n=1 Tax=Amborella trichopoda TaxID=13333 RepID=UPI0009C09B1C|nr:protein FAR1-RELATED SEQUENCE 5 isoform X1 [Amborella trichopoda]|eukprot:XP_020531997.1 protein FAR1-RELATED SEQUENCE 5 isoform X1 [Amborella trichopoda]